MTVANWIALALPIIGLLGASVLYVFQKRIDHRDSITAKKKAAYRLFLDALFEHAENRSEQTRRSYDQSKIAMLLVAPDAVIKEMVTVQEMATMDMDATGQEDVHAAVVGLILEMRNDCFNRSNLNLDELEYVTPIGKPTPLTAEPEGHFEPSGSYP